MTRESRALRYPTSEELTAEERQRLATSYTVAANGCWLSTIRASGSGYPTVHLGGQRLQANRAMYVLTYGPVPVGFDIDHLCRERQCVNPAHLEAVPHAENVRRGLAARREQRAVA